MPAVRGAGSPQQQRRGAGLRNPGVDGQLWGLITQYSRRLNLDPYAVAAVSRVEGGGTFGEVGDGGTSFGPFQLHVGGALPAGRDAAWANSPAGVLYAMTDMARSGAAGLSGRAAVAAIVTRFERPANPSAEVSSAWGGYRSFGTVPVSTSGGADTGNYQVGPVGGQGYARLMAQQVAAQRQMAAQFKTQQATLLQALQSQAAQSRQQALAGQMADKFRTAQQAQQNLMVGSAPASGDATANLLADRKQTFATIRSQALRRAGLG